MTSRASGSAQAFAATEAIRSGDWDAFLPSLRRAVYDRAQLLNPKEEPSRVGLAPHQAWVWMDHSGTPHWEVKGTEVQKIPLAAQTHESLEVERDALKGLIQKMLTEIERNAERDAERGVTHDGSPFSVQLDREILAALEETEEPTPIVLWDGKTNSSGMR
jgi:hypothetical protein